MIQSFKGEYAWLSNMHPVPIQYRGCEWLSTEAAYQAAKFDDSFWAKFVGIGGYEAKQMARGLPMGEHWTVPFKLRTMRELIALKFYVGSELAQKLLDTGEHELVEGNTWGDTFWGVCRGAGANHLGRILMTRRDVLNGLRT